MTYQPAGDHQFAIGVESTYGTAVAPTRILELLDESVKLNEDRIESKGLRTGRRVLSSTGWAQGNRSVEGDFSLEARATGMGLLHKLMLGASATTTPAGASTRRLHKATIGSLDGQSLTVQAIRTDSSTPPVRVKTDFTGVKIANWDISCNVNEFVQYKIGVDGRDAADSTSTLYSGTYPTGELLTYVGGAITIDGTPVSVKTASVKGDNTISQARYVLGSKLKQEQIEQAGLRQIDGSITVDWTNNNGLYAKFTGGTLASVVLKFESATVIESTVKASVTITLPACRFDGGQVSGGGEIIQQTVPFSIVDNGTDEPITIDYVTLDTSI